MRYHLYLALMLSLFIMGSLFAEKVQAWDQPPHRQINFEAVKVFLKNFINEVKFKNGPITKDGITESYRGISVKSSSLLNDAWRPAQWMGFDKYTIGEAVMSMPQWIAWGGDWADEPHLYASVRHFYDPLSMWGYPYLTDQFQYHGWYDSPKIDARKWALDHPENPFSFSNALGYYRAAMMTAESDTTPSGKISSSHFKMNYDLNPKDSADQRSIFLAHAYRALGESMHLLGDMTQPEHVRNDSHPIDSPIEKAMGIPHVIAAAQYPTVDARIVQYLQSAGGVLTSPAQLFHEVALFINQHFYSPDTIYDAEEGVIPQNIDIIDFLAGVKKPYPSPQFKDLLVEKNYVKSFIRTREVKMLCGPFINEKIPLTKERLSFHWFDPDMKTLEKIARNHHMSPYHIPPSYALDHARVQMPIAIYACADLMYHFFPTMELETTFTDRGIQEEKIIDIEDYRRQIIEIEPLMTHHQEKDMAWKEYQLKIDYAGPAQLVFSKDQRVLHTRKLHFLNGRLDKIENFDGKMIKAPLCIYLPEAGITLTPQEAFYQAEHGQTLYIQISAGSRLFKGPEYLVKNNIQVSILPPRIVLYELSSEANEFVHDFEAVARPDGQYRFVWEFGDGKNFDESKKPGESSKVSHQYQGVKGGDQFYPKVSLYDRNGDLLAEDTITLTIADQSPLNLPDTIYLDFRAYGVFDENNTSKGNEEIVYRINILSVPIQWTGNTFSGGKSGEVETGSHNSKEVFSWDVRGSIKNSPIPGANYQLISFTYSNQSKDPHRWGKDCYGETQWKIEIKDLPFYVTVLSGNEQKVDIYAHFNPRTRHYDFEHTDLTQYISNYEYRDYQKGRYIGGTYKADFEQTKTRTLKQILLGQMEGTKHENPFSPYNFWLEFKRRQY